jgi:hypothetical protein
MSLCLLCHFEEPNDWCWESRIDCPFRKPPRRLDTPTLWAYLVDFNDRLTVLERES